MRQAKPGGKNHGNTAAIYEQPPFAANITSLRWPLTGSKTRLNRGYMIWDRTETPPAGYGSYCAQVRFLFNPSEIAASYSTQAYGNTLQYTSSLDTSRQLTALGQTLSFSLLFDRTYELWNGQTEGDLAELGVDVDVRAMRQFTGMFSAVAGVSVTNNGLSQGVMIPVHSYLYFSGPGRVLSYYGYVDSWDVTYTHMSEGMVPMRCEVDVDFTLLPPATQTKNAGPGKNANSTGPTYYSTNPTGVGTGAGGGPHLNINGR